MGDYYEKLLQDIENCISEKDYRKASELVEGELKMPYVPLEVLAKLEQWQKELKPLLESEKMPTLLSKDKLVEYLKSDSEKAYLAINSLRQANIRNYLDEVEEYLLDPEGDRLMRSLLLQICHQQGVNQVFDYLDDEDILHVNPALIGDVTELDGFVETWQYLQKLLENDNPSFLKGCHDVLIQKAYRCYPQPLPENPEILGQSIIRYVYEAYGDEEGWQYFATRHDIQENNLPELSL